MSDRNALVIGASGFVASAVCRALAASGWNVVGLSRSGSLPYGRSIGTAKLMTVESYDEDVLADAFDEHRPNVVVNGAAYGIDPNDRDADTAIACNVLLVQRLVETAARFGTRVVHLGSCFEYRPGPTGVRLSEEWPLESETLYATSKTAGYLLGRAIARELGVSFVTLRLFGVYGPGEAPRRLLPHVIERLLDGERVPLTTGNQRRDLLFVDDAAAACVAIANLEKPVGGAFNVCSGRERVIRTVVETAARVIGADTDQLDFGALPQRMGEATTIVGDPSRIRAAAGWQPAVDLETGIEELVEHHTRIRRQAA